MPEPWTVTASSITYEDRWIRVRSDRCLTPAGRVVEPYHVLDYSDWLNVVALTPDREIVLIREYRHGAGRVLAGLPSGTMEPGEADPEAAARRELREETGFTGGRYLAMPRCFANPANQSNTVDSFLAVLVERTHEPCPDPNEEIEVLVEDFVGLMARLWRQEAVFQASHMAALHTAAHLILGGREPDLVDLRGALRREFLWWHESL